MRTTSQEYVSPGRFTELTSQAGVAINEQLASALGFPVYELPTGDVLIDYGKNHGLLWESTAAIRNGILASHVNGQHILQYRLPSGPAFSSKIPDLIERLGTMLGIPCERLDCSESSIAIIDNKVFHEIGPRDVLKNPLLFESLLAYLGEINRRAVYGRWSMVQDSETAAWIPVVVKPNNEKALLYINVYDALSRPDYLDTFDFVAW